MYVVKDKYDLLEFVGVPKRIREEMRRLEITVNPNDVLKSLYIYGPVGHGKTLYATSCLAYAIWQKNFTGSVLEMLDPDSDLYIGERKPEFSNKYLFIPVPELLDKIRKGFSKHDTEEDMVEICSRARILVLDDLGLELRTEWSYFTIYQIVGNRYNNVLPTIITSNLSLSELGKVTADERLISRISEMCGTAGIWKMEDTDYRLMRIKTE